MLDDKEVQLIAGSKEKLYWKNKIIIQNLETKNFYYNLEKAKCRHLAKNDICKVHSKKPRVCSDYPIFIVKNYIVTANNCPAVDEGVLNECLDELREIGYKIV